MAMKKRISVLFLIGVMLSLPFGIAASVMRDIIPDSTTPGSSFSVTIDANMDGGESFYSLKETIPNGWSIIDPDDGTVGADGAWRVTILSPSAGSNLHTYTMSVPDGAISPPPYLFDGDFGIVGGIPDPNEGTIGGETDLTITGGIGTVIRVDPSTQTVSAGGGFSIDIIVDGAIDLYGVQFDLAYDDDVLDFVSATGTTELLGAVQDSNDLSILDDQTGLLNDFVVLRSTGSVGVTGSGRVATVNFVANGPDTGVVSLTLSGTKLSDPDGTNPLVHTVQSGSVTVGECGDGIILLGIEECDEGRFCRSIEDGALSACSVDADCGSGSDGVCVPRDAVNGCSSICTDNLCLVDAGGVDVCTADELCSGNVVPSGDSASCCDSACALPSWSTCAQCGSGPLNGCDRTECDLISEGCYFIDTGLPGFFGSCTACGGGTSCTDYNGDSVTCLADSCSTEPPTCEFVGSCQAVATENDCTDSIDNDDDGSLDCQDSDCSGQIGPNGLVCCPTGLNSECPNEVCTTEVCSAFECSNTLKAAGAFDECTTTCTECDGVTPDSCADVSNADEGALCTGECSHCVSGSCDQWGANEFGECTVTCTACDGVGASCQPSTFTEGVNCPDVGNACVAGSCCPDADNDGVCDICVVDTDCNDNIECTTDSCGAGDCVFDYVPCLCDVADVNDDILVDIADIGLVGADWGNTSPPANLDVIADGIIDIFDLSFINSKITACELWAG
jgi:hypothetical protein